MKSSKLKISEYVFEKLRNKHHVTAPEIWECFQNCSRNFLEDIRMEHQTTPPTLWFIAETDRNRTLKVVFIELADGTYELKTAYEPNEQEINFYEKYT